jgi:hypothetical protein
MIYDLYQTSCVDGALSFDSLPCFFFLVLFVFFLFQKFKKRFSRQIPESPESNSNNRQLLYVRTL